MTRPPSSKDERTAIERLRADKRALQAECLQKIERMEDAEDELDRYREALEEIAARWAYPKLVELVREALDGEGRLAA